MFDYGVLRLSVLMHAGGQDVRAPQPLVQSETEIQFLALLLDCGKQSLPFLFIRRPAVMANEILHRRQAFIKSPAFSMGGVR